MKKESKQEEINLKNHSKMITVKNSEGITLIALVITIIVLLILAGVSIAMLTGDNGILTQANEAKEQTAYKGAEEKVKLAIMGARADDGQMTIEELTREVGLQGGNTTATAFPAEVQMDGYTFTVDNTGTVTGSGSEENTPNPEEPSGDGITSEDIANAENKDEFYGAIVKGYELPSGTTTDVNWKIFYADENNIYLIADNYVERENLPNSTTESGEFTTNKPNDGSSSYPRAAYFSNILGDYAGSARITDSKLKALNNSYFNENNFSSTNSNMKSVAYMMDTKAWNSKFKDVNNKAEYVIGGPTIEMLMKSYSQKYGVDYQARAKNATGYEISTDGGNTWKNYMDTSSEYLDTKDRLYVINSQSNARTYWMASPSADNTDYVMYVADAGYVSHYYYYHTYCGFRPLVSLKSDIQLQKNADGTYTIL